MTKNSLNSQLLSEGWMVADEYTKGLFPGAQYMRQLGGKNTPFVTCDLSIVKSNLAEWIPIHGSFKMPASSTPELAAQALMDYWENLPNEHKLKYVKSESPLVLRQAGDADDGIENHEKNAHRPRG